MTLRWCHYTSIIQSYILF